MSPISNILHKIDNTTLNILCMPTHERYEQNLSKTGHNFYSFRVKDGDFKYQIKDWNFTYGEPPSNYILLNPNLREKQIPDWIDFDLVLSQNKFGQFQLAHQFSRDLHLPLLSLEHTLPVPSWSDKQVEQITGMRGHENVYISEYSMKKWGGHGKVIHHGIDTETFRDLELPRMNKSITVVNDFINREIFCGYSIWRDVTKDIDRTIIGSTPGLSKPAHSLKHLVELYNQHTIYLNTSTVSPVPTALLEGMSCGLCPISTATCMIPEIIEHEVNGFISNDPNELRSILKHVMKNPDLAREVGYNARKTIEEKFGLNKFVNNWNLILQETAQMPYRGEFH